MDSTGTIGGGPPACSRSSSTTLSSGTCAQSTRSGVCVPPRNGAVGRSTGRSLTTRIRIITRLSERVSSFADQPNGIVKESPPDWKTEVDGAGEELDEEACWTGVEAERDA